MRRDAAPRRKPSKLTTSAVKTAREGRLFIDYLRNGRGTTAVATFSPRARRGLPIAAPTSWEALDRGIRPDAYTLARPLVETPCTIDSRIDLTNVPLSEGI